VAIFAHIQDKQAYYCGNDLDKLASAHSFTRKMGLFTPDDRVREAK
jgi:hypothetical protein